MGLGHDHDHVHDSEKSIRVAFFLNLSFTLIEVAGGLYTNSLAILSDALHDLGDSFAIGLSWYMEKQAGRPAAGAWSYGYRRLSLLAGLINALILIIGSLFILAFALPRLFAPEPANAEGMLLLAILGVAVNGAAVLRLRGGKNLNMQVISWHLMEDVLGWLAVLVVSLALMVTELHVLDPLLSILITGYVLYNVVRHLHSTLTIFLQAAPANLNIDTLNLALAAIPNVLSTHHTHAWSLDGEHHVFTTHLVVPAHADKAMIGEVKRAALQLMRDSDLMHTTIEIEYADETCRLEP